MSVRLQTILARAGIASRRAAERLISEGRVRVNGRVVRTLGSKADPAVDRIEVAGHGPVKREPQVYIALYKPVKVMTTVSDPEGRRTVVDLLRLSRAVGKRSYEGDFPRVFPVGRLDFNSEGILLLTNDGELAQSLLHPRHHVPKVYMVKVRGEPDDKALERLRRGVFLKREDGTIDKRRTAPAEVRVVKSTGSNTWLELTIVEGRNHQVKRMCQAVGHPASRLIRTEFGGISLDDLPEGAWRFLTKGEVDKLQAWSKGLDGPKAARHGRAKHRRKQGD